jgi:hypothetical protein
MIDVAHPAELPGGHQRGVSLSFVVQHFCWLQVLQRDRLVACLHEHVEQNCEHITVEHNVNVEDIVELESGELEVRWKHRSGVSGTSSTPFLVCHQAISSLCQSCPERSCRDQVLNMADIYFFDSADMNNRIACFMSWLKRLLRAEQSLTRAHETPSLR